MAHAATSVSVRTASLSISAMLWAALVLALSIGAQVATVAPGGPTIIEGVRIEDPPPREPQRKSQATQRTPEGFERVILPIPKTPETEPAAEPAALMEPVADGPVTITRAVWLRRPTPQELRAFYPPLALRRDRSGLVNLDCIVRTDGALDCAVLDETPPNYGFADAALRISRAYRMQPATRDGRPVEGRYQLRVPFELR